MTKYTCLNCGYFGETHKTEHFACNRCSSMDTLILSKEEFQELAENVIDLTTYRKTKKRKLKTLK